MATVILCVVNMAIGQKIIKMKQSKKQKDTFSEGLEIVVAGSLDEIEAIRTIWEQMKVKEPYPAISTDIDRYLSVLKASGDDVKPYVMVLRQNGQSVAMAIGRLEEHPIEVKLGYKVLLSPKLRCLTIVYGGILGQPGEELCSLLIGELMKVLNRREVDVVYFNHLRIDSPIYRAVRTIPTLWCRNHLPVLNAHWKALLPNSYEEYFRSRSKNTRHNIRRYSKKLVGKYGERLLIKCFTEAIQIDQFFKDTVKIAEKTYQHGLAAAFVDDIKTRRLINFFVGRKWLIAYLLYIDGNPCAFWHGIRYGNTFFTLYTGYDPAYHNDRLGMFLLVKMFEALCLKKNVDAIDFGFGNAQYKESFCDVSWQEASVYIFAPRPYPIFINMVRTFTLGLKISLEYILNKTGLVGWIKRRWRNLLQKDSRP